MGRTFSEGANEISHNESSIIRTPVAPPMDEWLFLGLTAGFFTTVGFVPQVIKSLRARSMAEVSLLMPLLLSLGMFLWLLYGLMKGDAPIILWNAIALALNLTLVGLKIYYSPPRGYKADEPPSSEGPLGPRAGRYQ